MTQCEDHSRPGGKLDWLNPYRIGMRLIIDRLTWDLSPRSWMYRRKIAALKDNYYGEKAVILCNGPSLKEANFSKLEDIFTFGLNKINLLFECTSFRPSAIVAVNPLVIQQNSDFYSTTSIPLFLDRAAIRHGIVFGENVYLLHSSDFPYFSRDCSFSIFQGFTVTYVALQLAYHMGFNKVALIGCDHNYHKSGMPNAINYNKDADPGHFCDNYFSPYQPWQYPDLKASEYYYDIARRCFEADNRLIVNASTRTQLDVFPVMSLDEFLENA